MRISALLAIGVWLTLSIATSLNAQEAKVASKIIESDDIEELVLVSQGELPIILSAPHGGTLKIAGVNVRQGEGMATGPSGFFTGRDGGTSELAIDVANALQKQTGKKPYTVISKAHRKYLDPNRPSEIAYEDSDAAPVYQRYHGTLQRYCKEILEKYHTGLLLDIHGQGSSSQTVYRGTANGKTVARLKERFGDQAHTGDESFFGMLNQLGWQVYPFPADGKEQSGFTGGYIVQTHGSHRPTGLDAIQLEFGSNYRDKENRNKTAQVLSQAILQYINKYIDPIASGVTSGR